LTSLLAFNVGVELGQLLVLVILVPLLNVLFRVVVVERIGTIILSAFVAHAAWHWLLERGATLSQYRVGLPTLDLALAVSILRGLMVLVFIAGCGWGTYILARRLGAAPALEPERSPRGAAE
jgi:hypothetical protein